MSEIVFWRKKSRMRRPVVADEGENWRRMKMRRGRRVFMVVIKVESGEMGR